MRQNLLRGLLLTLLCVPLILPFLHKGFPKTQDGTWAVIRLVEMRRELKDLQIPPRWSGFLNHGYGYPLFLFTYPFPYYVGQLFYIPGVSPEIAIKILFILSTILSAVTMYLFTKDLWGDNGAFLSTALYLYAPYRLLNLFSRGSIGELFAAIFYPLLFLFFKKIVEKPTIGKILTVSIILGCLILSHNASVVLFLPFLSLWIVYLLFTNKQNLRRNLVFIIATFFLAFLLTAYFWLPAILDKKYISLSRFPLADKSQHFLTFSQLLGNSIHPATEMFLQIGKLPILLLLLNIILLISHKWKKNRSVTILFFVFFLISIFLTQPISLFLWNLPFIKEIDFPWRILGISAFLVSILGGSILNFKKGYYLIIPLLLIILLNTSLIKSDYVYNETSFYDTNDATTTSNDELMPIWVKDKPKNRYIEKIDLPKNSGSYNVLIDKSNNLNFNVELKENTTIKINTLFFLPLWKAYEDKVSLPIFSEENTGRILLNLDSGKHNIQINFNSDYSNESFANMVTIVGIILFVSLWVYSKKYRLG